MVRTSCYKYLKLVHGFYAVNCQLKALKCDGLMLFIMQMMCIVVAQKLRCFEDFGFE